jgi:hypothetical protein
MVFSFPLRGRKAKFLSLTGHDGTLIGDSYLPMVLFTTQMLNAFPLLSSQQQRKNIVTLRPLRL